MVRWVGPFDLIVLSAVAGGVGAEVMNIMFPRLWYLCQNPCDKLEDIESFSIGMREQRVVVRTFGLVEKRFGTLCPMNARETYWAAKHVASEPFETLSVMGPNGG